MTERGYNRRKLNRGGIELKRWFAAFLAVTLLLVFAPQSLADDSYATATGVVYFNGEQMEATARYGMVQYVPIAKMAGYETSYDEKTHSVTSRKGDDEIYLSLYTGEIKQTKGGIELPRNWALSASEVEGSTYISQMAIEVLFGYITIPACGGNDIDIFDIDELRKQFIKSVPNVVAYSKAVMAPENFSSRASYGLDFRADSTTFGIHLSGNSSGKLALDKQDSVMSMDIDIDSEGIYNFIALFRMLGQQWSVGDDVYKGWNVSIDDPFKGQAYYDGEELYLKSETLAPGMVYSYLPTHARQEYKAQLADKARDSWIKLWFDNTASKGLKEGLDAFMQSSSGDNTEEVLSNLATIVFSVYPYAASDSTGGSRFAQRKGALDTLAAVLNGACTVTEQDGQTIWSFELNSSDFKAIYNAVSPLLWNDELMAVTSFEVNSQTVCNADGSLETKMSLLTGLDNIPNSLGIQCGTVTLRAEMTEKTTPGGKPIAKPVEYLDFEQAFYEGLTN